MLTKRDIFERFEQHGGVYALVVSTEHGPTLPETVMEKPIAVLQLGRALTRPPHPVVSDEGVRVSLSFNFADEDCFIPWDCIHTIGDDTSQVSWPLKESDKAPTKPKLGLVK